MKSERSRTIIRTHHRLQKEHAAALKRGDAEAAAEASIAIEMNGGIKRYQAASKQGQAKDRGGDSSKVLVEWLQKAEMIDFKARNTTIIGKNRLQCLEIGALSTQNEISKFPSYINMTRIDLNSQGEGIQKQDFMERPLPTNNDERFDIISLSLVLNYVPEATGRGGMLKRLAHFLRINPEASPPPPFFPVLFLVLPLPCVENSRYLDRGLLLQIMASLGFILRHSKISSKLCYYIFSWTGKYTGAKTEKKKIKDAPGLNNFSIIVG